MSLFRISLAVAAATLLAGCGFQPLHGGAIGRDARAELATVRIEPIEERIGQMLRNELLDAMNPTGAPERPEYRLSVTLVESRQELAVRRSEFATRANLQLVATYRLAPAGNEKVVTTFGSSNVIASYDILSNDYATLAAEADARKRAVREISDDITQRLAAFFHQNALVKK